MAAPLRLPLLLLALGPVGRASASPPAPSPRNRTLLFIDEHEVLYSSAVARELRPLTRHTPGTPVLPMDRPWEKLLAYSAVHVVDGEYRMWCAPRPQPAQRRTATHAPHRSPPAAHRTSLLQWSSPAGAAAPAFFCKPQTQGRAAQGVGEESRVHPPQ